VSYIDKNSNIVVSARLTDKGRELLANGALTFNTFKLGDSEIDYTTLGPTYDITLNNVLRAKANQPDMKTFLLPTTTSTPNQAFMGITQLTALELVTTTQAPELGFFETSTASTEYTAYTSTNYVLQADSIIPLSGLTGCTNVVPVIQSASYGVNTYEPSIGDFMLVKMSNNQLALPQTDGVIDENVPVPYLWFRVQDKSGTLSANTLNVTLDRNFPYYPGYVGSNHCWAAFYPTGNTFSTGGIYSAGTVWNMNNVWSYPIAGADDGLGTYETFNNYGSENYIGSKEYFGYTSEITSNCEDEKSIAIIHYTNVQTCNNQSENVYGQRFYIDTTVPSAPKIKMPTLMWHGRVFSGSGTADKIGESFSGTGVEKYVTLSGVSTEVRYYDLVDSSGNNFVGRVFPDHEVFTVDNQELVAALSYKSNRNWTLPTMDYGLFTSANGLIGQTQDLYVSYMFENTSACTTSLHAQNYTCVVVSEEECPDNAKKDVQLTFPTSSLPYMMVSGGTGFQADKFYIITQRVTTGNKPTSDGWFIMDYTNQINGHTTGTTINPINLENTTFTINNTMYISGSTLFDLHNYINIPTTSETNLLQFGDENFFFGNIEAAGSVRKWRTKFNIVVPPTMFNTTTNPTWLNSAQNVHISEVGIYSTGGDLVAIGKMNLPIEKNNTTTVIIEIAFDL
jgi:hypothetical protein